jgi:hypothetical protein
MHIATQFSVFLVNKPGVLAMVSNELARAKVNIVAMTMMDSMEHGVLRLVAEDTEKTRTIIASLNVPKTETNVLVAELPNRPGALADVCSRLAKGHVNINYAYATTGAKGGKAKVILKVADEKKALKLLSEPPPRRRDMNKKLRSPAGLRGK